MKTNDFILKIGKMAQLDMDKTGILASLTIAQAILESSWGGSELARNANNYLGMKGSYNGASYKAKTKEFVGGKRVEVYADFRKYPSLQDCINDHSNKFLTQGIYSAVRGETDYKKACKAVHKAGYASAPDYADRLIEKIEQYKLYQFDEVKTEVNKMKKVFLGVGHGGKDPGAVSGNIREKDLNLGIALACRAELERHGVQVLMSRTKDEDDTLTDEIKECNQYKPDLAVDIHNNAGGGDGFEAYYSLLKTVNGVKSQELASKIEAEVKAIGQNSRGIKTKANSSGQDWFGFVREPRCPSILVECAFVDSKDVQIVDTSAEQAIMGVAVARGILKTLGIAVKIGANKQTKYFLKVAHFNTLADAQAAQKKAKDAFNWYSEIKSEIV